MSTTKRIRTVDMITKARGSTVTSITTRATMATRPRRVGPVVARIPAPVRRSPPVIAR